MQQHLLLLPSACLGVPNPQCLLLGTSPTPTSVCSPALRGRNSSMTMGRGLLTDASLCVLCNGML